jgi:cytidine deaminase
MNKNLLTTATEAMDKAYSPYSKIRVGAAILTENGESFSGCNIENSSYGATVCAERVAIWKAISTLGKIKIKEVIVMTEKGWPPCGQCRQVIAEFATKDTKIHVCSTAGAQKTYLFSELQPEAFTPDYLLE